MVSKVDLTVKHIIQFYREEKEKRNKEKKKEKKKEKSPQKNYNNKHKKVACLLVLLSPSARLLLVPYLAV